MNILVDVVPAAYRKYAIYAPYALAGLILGAFALVTRGSWVTDALTVYAFVGSALGLTASANTTVPVEPPVAPIAPIAPVA